MYFKCLKKFVLGEALRFQQVVLQEVGRDGSSYLLFRKFST